MSRRPSVSSTASEFDASNFVEFNYVAPHSDFDKAAKAFID